MSKKTSTTRIITTVVATCALWWLVDNVNTHGNELQQGLANVMDWRVAVPLRTPIPRPGPEAGGLDLIDMYACAWGPVKGIEGWVGLWLVTVLVGGLPTAKLSVAEP